VNADLLCPSCQAPVVTGDRYCEACGATLPDNERPAAGQAEAQPGAAGPAAAAAARACVNCGAVDAVGDDGYCEQCGFKQPDPHDHEEIDLGAVAGVTDRGLHHRRNEDALAVIAGATGSAMVVVCDGVSSSANADVAAKAAVAAAEQELRSSAGGTDDVVAALGRAAAAAQAAVLGVHRSEPGDEPSCTFVAAVWHGGVLTVAWIGDSRAYWFGAGGDTQLTTDDSWAAEQVAAGTMSVADAEGDERAHSITRWLGADSPEQPPRTATFSPSGPGRVVVCSDGLWNYASSADSLAAQLAGLAADAAPLAVARHLTNFARDCGGHDNITVAVIAV